MIDKILFSDLVASLIGLITLPAQAITVIQPPPSSTFFYFSGNCVDCARHANTETYGVSGKLVLNNYLQGSEITPINFVSFIYYKSNLLEEYIIRSSGSTITGSLSFISPNANQFHVTGVNNYFDLSSSGNWETGLKRPTNDDMGNSGKFGPNAVPEPGTILLMGAALAAAGLARRRRQR